MQIYKYVSQAELTKKYKCFYLFSTIYLTFNEQPFRSKVELCKTKKQKKILQCIYNCKSKRNLNRGKSFVN